MRIKNFINKIISLINKYVCIYKEKFLFLFRNHTKQTDWWGKRFFFFFFIIRSIFTHWLYLSCHWTYAALFCKLLRKLYMIKPRVTMTTARCPFFYLRLYLGIITLKKKSEIKSHHIHSLLLLLFFFVFFYYCYSSPLSSVLLSSLFLFSV